MRAPGERFVALRRSLAVPGLVAALVLVSACGSSGSDITESEATAATNEFMKTTLGLFTGTTEPQAFIDQYAPECRDGVDVSGLAFLSAFMQGMAPELRGVAVEAVDVGPLKIEDADGGVHITPRDPEALRVQIDGQFVPAADFFSNAGFESTEGGLAEPLFLVRRDGAVYLGDCSELHDLAGGVPGS